MYNKIYIIWPVGSGKTTLSNQLSEKYSIEKYELDKIVWDDENGNIKRSDGEIDRFIIYKRCVSRWVKQKIGKEKYNYKPTLKGLFEMLRWAKQDIKNKNEKILIWTI